MAGSQGNRLTVFKRDTKSPLPCLLSKTKHCSSRSSESCVVMSFGFQKFCAAY
jgi:hypothetical protein